MAETAKPPSKRTLEADIPELKEYLRPGVTVLDIGCGTGTITLDVAAAVHPGEVIGIDSDERRIKIAQEWAAQRPAVDNASFRPGDSHTLDFPDNTFDVVYSHTVLHFFLDPVAALKEQARVAKPGGWVVASGVREVVYSVRNPPCPNWDRYMEARRVYSEKQLQAFRRSALPPAEYLTRQLATNPTHMEYMDAHGGRKCSGWLLDAGLTDISMSIKAEHLRYQGSPDMEPAWYVDVLPSANPEHPMENELIKTAGRLMEEGLLDSSTFDNAKKEISAWYKDPHAFFFFILVFGAGRVPAAN